MRGEHSYILDTTDYARGSSPHARGTHWIRSILVMEIGIIPACAGNTLILEGR